MLFPVAGRLSRAIVLQGGVFGTQFAAEVMPTELAGHLRDGIAAYAGFEDDGVGATA